MPLQLLAIFEAILNFEGFQLVNLRFVVYVRLCFWGEAISNLKSLEFVSLRFKHYILGKMVSIFASHLCALCFWEKWSLFLHHIYGHCVFGRGGLCLASHFVHHVYMHCVFVGGGLCLCITFMCIMSICIVFLVLALRIICT
jgi:hypothetical protein